MARKKEVRQRGKKNRSKKAQDGADDRIKAEDSQPLFVEDREGGALVQEQGQGQEATSTPSWLLDRAEPVDLSIPFGLVDPDLKAYLRSAHVKLQENIVSASEEGRRLQDDDDVKTLRNAMLDEVKGKELTLATDTDTSVILEEMLSTFGARQAKILGHALSNESYTLVCHRFGSHVLQSVLVALQYFASQEALSKDARGESALPSAEQLIIDISRALRDHTLDVIRNQFASHALRTLLLVLTGMPAGMESLRSKRSKTFHRKTQLVTKTPWSSAYQVVKPPSFETELGELLRSIKQALADPVQIRALCVDPIAGPTLSLIVESSTRSDGKDKQAKDVDLLDACLDGLVSSKPTERSAHVETLLRDSVGSHVLEQVLKAADQQTLNRFWDSYVSGRLAKLGTHPTANFVAASVLRRLEATLFTEACDEVQAEGSALVTSRHLGTLIALIDRAGQLAVAQPEKPSKVKKTVWNASDCESHAVRAVLRSFGIEGSGDAEEDDALVLVLLSGKTVAERKKAAKAKKRADKQAKRKRKADDAAAEEEDGGTKKEDGQAGITLQGSLLCQSLARLGQPANQPLLDSILNLDDLMPIAGHPSGVHTLLAAVHSPRLAFAYRSKLSAKVLAQLVPLLSDKFGSRLIDSTFDGADLFFKEKIARACLASERALLASNYGRYFLKRIQLALFRRDVVQWKQQIRALQQHRQEEMHQLESAAAASHKGSAEARDGGAQAASSRKKQKRAKIDDDLEAILANI